MVELVDTQDLKSCEHCVRAGSIPASSTGENQGVSFKLTPFFVYQMNTKSIILC